MIPSAARLRDGTLLVAYREGSDHWRTPDGVVRLCRSTDGGRSWGSPETILAEEGRNFGCHLGLRQHPDGRVFLPIVEGHHVTGRPAYFRYYDRMLKSPLLMVSTDDGATWTTLPGWDLGPTVIWTAGYGDVLLGHDGEIAVSMAWQAEGEAGYHTGLIRSRDGGHTWESPRAVSYGLDDEQSVCALPDGRLVAVLRDYDRPSRRCFSDDDGRTWTTPEPLPFHGQSPSLLATPGALLCAFRDVAPDRPTGVGLAYSLDGGETWTETDPLYVAPEGFWDCAYPNLIDLRDGELLCVYYAAAIGTRRRPGDPGLYADADNAIEAVRFRILDGRP